MNRRPFPHRAMLAPMLVAGSLRLALMLAAYTLTGTRVMTQGDTASYLDPGRNLLLHGVFAAGGQLEIDRTPGYPLFVMLTGMALGNVLLAASAQILVSLAIMPVLRAIAGHVFPDRNIGVRAAWLYAVEPLSILYTVRLMPETLFILLLLLSVERLLAFQSSLKLSCLGVSGTLLAAATYVRPVSWYLGFLFAAGIAFTVKPDSLRWKAPAILLLSLVPWLAAWQIRNAVEAGYNGFSSIVEKNLYFFQSAEITAELKQVSLEAEQEELGYRDDSAYLASHPQQRAWTRSQRLHFMRAQSMQILAQHPIFYLESHLKGVAVVAFSPAASEWLQMLGAYPDPQSMPRRILNEGVAASVESIASTHPGVASLMALFEAFQVALYVLAVRGLLNASRNRLATYTILGIAFYFLLISGGAQAVGRYRLPVMPFLCLFAAAGISIASPNETRSLEGSAFRSRPVN